VPNPDELPSVERLLEASAYTVYMATLIGNAPPAIRALSAWLKHPQPGDLVLEISTIHQADRVGRLGILERVEQEYADPEDAALPEADRPGTEPVYYLRGLNGRPARWFNASFIRVVTDPSQYDRLHER
jgi:hypothetical protein